MSKLRIAVILHPDLIPPEKVPKGESLEYAIWQTEYIVIKTLRKLGHEVEVIGVYDEILPIRQTIENFKPHVAFNLLEEFNNQALFDQHVVSYFELMNLAYTGCNPRGLTLARDKALAKKILTYHKIKTPKFLVFPKNQRPKVPRNTEFPLIVKCLYEEASLGIAQASVVTSKEKLLERVEYIHERFGVDAIAEQFIAGRELYVGVLGNYKLQAFHPWILQVKETDAVEKEIYTSKAKFNEEYRKEKGIRTGKASISDEMVSSLQKISKRAFHVLSLNGYGRMDFRVTSEGEIYLLEANPNPDIADSDDFAQAAKDFGYSYEELLGKIMSLGRSWASRLADD